MIKHPIMIIKKKCKTIKNNAVTFLFIMFLSCSTDNYNIKIAAKQTNFVVDWCTIDPVLLISEGDVVSLKQNEDCTYDVQCESGEEYRVLYQNAFEEWVTETFICSQSETISIDILKTKNPYHGELMTDRISLGDTLQIMGTIDHWALKENVNKILVWRDENGHSIQYPDMKGEGTTHKLHTGQKAETMFQHIREYEKGSRKIGTTSQNTSQTVYYYFIINPDTLLVESNNYRWNGLTWLYEELNK